MTDIINCYHKNFGGGIGDFIKGSIYLYQQAQKHKLSIDIDWQYHPIGEFISSGYSYQYDPEYVLDIEELALKLMNPYSKSHKHWTENTEDWITYILFKIIENKQLRPAIISSWYSTIEKIQQNKLQTINRFVVDEQCKATIKNKINFSKDIDKIFNNKRLTNYSVLHFRLGDRHILPDIDANIEKYNTKITNHYNLSKFNHDYDYYYYLIRQEMIDNSLQNVIVMSDSNDFKQFILENTKSRHNIHVLHLNSTHTSFKPGLLKYTNFYNETTRESYRDTALDLKYIIHSNINITYSCYPWGSGFVVWPSKLYDIPLRIRTLDCDATANNIKT